MGDKKCPLCGNDIHDDSVFCKDCRQIAQDELPEGFYERDVNGEELDEKPKDSHDNEELKAVGISSNDSIQRKKSSIVCNIILLILGGAIFLAAGWYAAKEVIENKALDQTEAIFWSTCEEENTLLAYSKYLVKYPEGQYAALAESKIEEFHAIETDEWVQIQQMNDIADLIGYSRANLGTSYQEEISRKIDSLAWVKAKAEGSKTAYQFYLDNVALGFFLGNHKEEAQTLFGTEEVTAVVSEPQKVEEVKLPVAVTGKDLDDISKRIYDLADNISRFRFDRAKKQMVPTLDNYFGMRKKTASTIFSEFKNDMYKKGIKTQGYYILPKSLNVKVDDKGTYFVEVKVQKKITYISSKKKPVDEYLSLKIELSKNKLVQSIDKS